MSEFGIPYQGSKDSIAKSVLMNLPKAENFYDLFGGGFSVTQCAIECYSHKWKNFFYNEIQEQIVTLVKRAINGDFNYSKFKPPWISKDDFLKLKDTDPYVRVCWSFGNNQKNYLYGEVESYKKSMHNAVIFDEFDVLAKEVLQFDKWPFNCVTVKQKRIYLRQKIEWYNKNKAIPKVLYKFLSDEQIKEIGKKDNVKQLQRLQQLQQLERLQRLERLQQLELVRNNLMLTSLDYRNVIIKPNSVVYCDIPYKNTAQYLNEFNHDDFYKWALSREYPVFISEYSMPSDFKLIYTIDKRVLSSSQDNSLKSQEKLYWNGK